jgi:hypothetical protein
VNQAALESVDYRCKDAFNFRVKSFRKWVRNIYSLFEVVSFELLLQTATGWLAGVGHFDLST